MRAAVQWSLEQRTAEAALRLGAVLWQLWWSWGYAAEGRDWLGRILALAEGLVTRERASVLIGAGMLASMQADVAAAEAAYTQGLALARANCCRGLHK